MSADLRHQQLHMTLLSMLRLTILRGKHSSTSRFGNSSNYTNKAIIRVLRTQSNFTQLMHPTHVSLHTWSDLPELGTISSSEIMTRCARPSATKTAILPLDMAHVSRISKISRPCPASSPQRTTTQEQNTTYRLITQATSSLYNTPLHIFPIIKTRSHIRKLYKDSQICTVRPIFNLQQTYKKHIPDDFQYRPMHPAQSSLVNVKAPRTS